MAKRGKEILVLGNGPQIGSIKFDLIKPAISTFGVNRIWLKHHPDYFFFHDRDILMELERDPILLSKVIGNSQCFTSDWLKKEVKMIPNWVRCYSRFNRRAFPDSVTTGMRILGQRYLKGPISDYTFYLAGINLRWTQPSHFWKSDYDSLNDKGSDWYLPRFKRVLKNFIDLQNSGFNMVSVTPDSDLNKILRSINIENLYSKQV